MEFLRTDADFRAKPELEPVRKPCRCIHVDAGRINHLLEAAGCFVIVCHNGFRVPRSIAANIGNRFFHGINDTDTADLMEVQSGSLYKTKIVNIRKGISGTPGELTGVIDYKKENRIGAISINSVEGIFGTLSQEEADEIQGEALPVGLKQEVKKGEAQILSCLEEDGAPQLYTIEIKALHLDHDNINRGIEIQVTDERLLEKTGGIVQGMSGSPILQNGKIVGAVTHVFVNDPTRGYGIFIENMLQAG